MKKVLSVAMASAMVLGMGANAFAISYSSGSNNKADWPKNFQFDGELFVTNKDGDIITEATTALNDNETVNFEPGDVIWMPLYADDQLSYTADYTEGKDEVAAINNIKLADSDFATTTTVKKDYYLVPGEGWYANKADAVAKRNMLDMTGWTQLDNKNTEGFHTVAQLGADAWVSVPTEVVVNVNGSDETREVETVKVVVDGKTYSGSPAKVQETLNKLFEEEDAYGAQKYGYSISGTVTTKKVAATDDKVEKPEVDNTDGVVVEYGHYTGNIDKNWSINLIEKSTGVAELIEKAELYKATATDYASYNKYTQEIMPNAVYLKVTLKKEWKTTSSETLKYYVYVANNKSNTQKTNEVWVSGKYENTDVREVSFDWTNDASKAGLWKVKEGNGIAVFDFADKAFFSVKMYEGETMYLDLGTAYDKAIAGEMDAEADSFYKFDNTNANFARTGELIIVSDDSSLVPYEIDADGNFVKVDAEYVENYAVAHTNQKVNGFVFNTKQLGNYVLSTEELGEEEEPAEPAEEPDEEPAPSEPVEETPAPETNKPNPNTGAEDFVGLAVSLAVVSVAAAGALALKK